MSVPFQDVQSTLNRHIEAGEPHTGWEELWAKRNDRTLPWDKLKPNPALEEVLTTKRAIIGAPVLNTSVSEAPLKRKKALVPGCGRGVDVFLLASFGYDAFGLEYSKTAIDECKKEEEDAEQKYPVRDESIGRGKVTWIQGDFFENDWVDGLSAELEGGSFDFIYDYTVRMCLKSVKADNFVSSSAPCSLRCGQPGLCDTLSFWHPRPRAISSV